MLVDYRLYRIPARAPLPPLVYTVAPFTVTALPCLGLCRATAVRFYGRGFYAVFLDGRLPPQFTDTLPFRTIHLPTRCVRFTGSYTLHLHTMPRTHDVL